MKHNILSSLEINQTPTSTFYNHKLKQISESVSHRENSLYSHRPAQSRNISYFKDILHFSRNTISYPMQISERKINKISPAINKEILLYTSRVNEPIQQDSSLIIQNIKPFPMKYNQKSIDLNNYYDQLELATIDNEKSIVTKTDNFFNKQSLSPLATMRETERSTHHKKTNKKTRISLYELFTERTSTPGDNAMRTTASKTGFLDSIRETHSNNLYDKKRNNSHFTLNSHHESQSPMKSKHQRAINNSTLPPSILKEKMTHYRMTESLKSIRTKLKNKINILAFKSIKNNEDIKIALDKTKQSEYTKEIIEKIKLVNSFLCNQSKDKFRSQKLRYRRIFVMLDGQTVFSERQIEGDYIDIPTKRYLDFLKSKKERLGFYYEFLAKAEKILHSNLPFKNVFLLSGINIFDLGDIPPEDKAVYVSMSVIFRGVHLFNEPSQNKKNIEVKDYDLLRLDNGDIKLTNGQKLRRKNLTRRIFVMKKKKAENKPLKPKIFKTIHKKIKYLREQSFTEGYTENKLEWDEFIYYSDNDCQHTLSTKELHEKYPSLMEQILYLSRQDQQSKIEDVKKINKAKLKKLIASRPNEDTEIGMNLLLQKYNIARGNKYNINMGHQKRLIEEENQEKIFKKETKGMGIELLKNLKIFNKYKNVDIILDEKEFYRKEMLSDPINSIISKNIAKTYNITPIADKDVQQFFPDLIAFNIPKILKDFPKVQRKELYDVFVQFKTLILECVCINRNLKIIKKGIDFETFYNCNAQVKSQGVDIAEKIFKTLNILDAKYINWNQYMKGMLTMKSTNIEDKLDMFFKVIDTDGNGMLSFDEVYDLSVKSLGRSIGGSGDQNEDPEEIVQVLATYFANLIFQLVGLPIDEEIPLDLIKDKIIEGRSAAGYLEMFICADNFM